MGQTVAFVYGVVAYGLSLVTFLYAVGFVGNLFVPNSIDGGAEEPFGRALSIDAFLLALFATQHSGMAREGFKKWWMKIVCPAVERSTYVLIASLFLLVVFSEWRPIAGAVWEVDNPTGQRVLESFFWLGWVIAFHSTFLIDHFGFFGLRQVYLYAHGKDYASPRFKMPELYRYVRHPMMMGLLMAIWATPVMTVGHFLFAVTMTAYIVVGIRLEERDLVNLYGRAYQEYRRRVSMIIPLPRKK